MPGAKTMPWMMMVMGIRYTHQQERTRYDWSGLERKDDREIRWAMKSLQ